MQRFLNSRKESESSSSFFEVLWTIHFCDRCVVEAVETIRSVLRKRTLRGRSKKDGNDGSVHALDEFRCRFLEIRSLRVDGKKLRKHFFQLLRFQQRKRTFFRHFWNRKSITFSSKWKQRPSARPSRTSSTFRSNWKQRLASTHVFNRK